MLVKQQRRFDLQWTGASTGAAVVLPIDGAPTRFAGTGLKKAREDWSRFIWSRKIDVVSPALFRPEHPSRPAERATAPRCAERGRRRPRRGFALLLAAVGGLLLGCEPENPVVEPPAPVVEELTVADLDGLRELGYLRVLVVGDATAGTPPGSAEILPDEAKLIGSFAQRVGLEPQWRYVHSRGDLVPALLEGRGDMIYSEADLDAESRARVACSVPVDLVDDKIVMRHDDDVMSSADLSGRTIAAQRDSRAWQALEELAVDHPGMRISEIPDTLSRRQVIAAVARGELDLAVADNRLIAATAAQGLSVRGGLDLGTSHALTWYFRPTASALAGAANRFLNESRVLSERQVVHLDDLPGIRQRGVLRVLTRTSPVSYFVWRGQLRGFEYDLMNEFVRQEGLHLEMIIPPPEADLIDWLLEGRGDVIAAALAITDARRKRGIEFTRRYHQAVETLVMRHTDRVATLAALDGRTIVVNRHTSYWQTVERIQAQGIAVHLEPPPEPLGTTEIISRVADGEFDLTVADDHIIAMERSWRDDIESGPALSSPVDHGWAVRREDTQLLAALNRFIRSEYRGLYYNVIYDRYFGDHSARRSEAIEMDPQEGLSPWDEIVRKYAKEYGFDWRLIIALMFQESHFNPDAVSSNGAVGLMQMLPSTARELGFSDIRDPERGIEAGVRYLAWIRDRFEPELPVNERTWLTLAAYNAGYGHVQDARRLAARLGFDRNRWFGHVEKAMLLLSRPDYAQEARHGYCRGGETAAYVRGIRDRFVAYASTVDSYI